MDSITLRQAVVGFLAEDIGSGDLTSEAIFTPADVCVGELVAKEDFVACGMESVAGFVFTVQNPLLEISDVMPDGERVSAGDRLLRVKGPVVDLLRTERVALNLVQRLCGIATLTARFVKQVKPLPVRVVDTRKTTPGLRMLEKYAVRVGGGFNHRFNLADGVLIKDNHIAACGSIRQAVARVRQRIPHTIRLEVECTDIEQVRECLAASVDIIMLDNMPVERMREVVKMVDGRAMLEASGGITLDNVREVAETGVDLISVGGLTHSARACDISMRMVTG